MFPNDLTSPVVVEYSLSLSSNKKFECFSIFGVTNSTSLKLLLGKDPPKASLLFF